MLTSLCMTRPVCAQKSQFHVETYEEKRFTITVTDTFPYPSGVPRLILIATVPPSLPSQKDLKLTMWYDQNQIGTPGKEGSSLHRQILSADINAAAHPAITLVYEGTLSKRRLAQGAPVSPVPDLTPDERQQTLAYTTMCDFNRPEFQVWLNEKSLHPQKKEDDLRFGYRAFCFVKDKYTYRHDENSGAETRTSCFLRTVDTLDCGEAVLELSAILRANSIPCRIKVGRNVVPDNTHEYGAQRHVKAEFYARSIGWIPVEVAGALGLPDTTYTFGYDSFYFLTTHVENNMVFDTKYWGPRTMHWASVMRFWGSIGPSGETKERWTIQEVSAVRK